MFMVLLMNSIVIANAILLTRNYFIFASLSDYLIALFLVYLAQIVFTLQLLGILNILYLPQVLILNTLILIVVILLVNYNKKKRAPGYANLLPGLKAWFTLNRIEKLCLAAIIGFGLVKLAINLINPPFGWDNLNYHFTFPVEWMKHGNLDNPMSISGDFSVSYYPIDGNLFFLWFILPLKNVFLADLGQFPFFIAAFLAVFAIGRKIGLAKENAFFSAALFSLIPNYFKQLRIAYVDIMVAALFLMTLNFIFQAKRERTLSKIFLASVSLGLMLGTKTTAMPQAILLFVPLLIIILLNFKSKIIPAFVLAAVGIIIFGGYSFIKNILDTGNPLYPLNLQLFNFTVFKGVVDNSVYRTAIRPGDFSLAKLLFSEGLGAQTLLLVLPAVLSAPLIILKEKRSINLLFAYLLILPILLILVFRFVLPLPNIRYVYALFALGLIIAFYWLTILKVPKIVVRSLVFICVIASVAENGKRLELVFSIIITVLLFILIPVLFRLIRRRWLKKILLVSLALIFLGLMFLQKNYLQNEYLRYLTTVKLSGYWPDATKAWLWLNENTTGNNIAYIGRPVAFPLYGTGFKNNVYYVSVNTTEPALLHYYPNSKYIWGYDGNFAYRNFEDKDNYRGNADYNVWLKNLSKNNTDYLFVYSEINTKAKDSFPMEDKWASSHPEKFVRTFENGTIHIYRIKNEND